MVELILHSRVNDVEDAIKFKGTNKVYTFSHEQKDNSTYHLSFVSKDGKVHHYAVENNESESTRQLVQKISTKLNIPVFKE